MAFQLDFNMNKKSSYRIQEKCLGYCRVQNYKKV